MDIDIDIEKRYSINELIDYHYDDQLKKYKKYRSNNYYDSLESGIPLYNEKENYNDKYKKKHSKSMYLKKITSSIIYILGLGLYIYQIINFNNQINYIIKQPFGLLYGYFLIAYPIIFSLSIVFMNIMYNKRKQLFVYDIAILSIIISSLLLFYKNYFYGKYLIIQIITLVGSLPFIITYICIPILKIIYLLIM